MLRHKKVKISNGFTLVELLVSAFIIALVSSVFMVNYHNTNKRSGLTMAKQKLASDIRLAQNNSLGSKDYNGVNVWGVHFALSGPGEYIIFADKPVDGELEGNKTYEADEAVETKTLPAGITINSLSPDDEVDVVFFPPNPVTYINGLAVYDNQARPARIVLKESITNSTAAVTVNLFGLIDVE